MNLEKIRQIIIFIMVIILLYLLDGLYCPINKVFNLYCPGCGITRCIISFLQFNFYQSFRYNPLIFILLPFLSVYIIYKLYIWLFDKKDNIITKIPNMVFYILIIILLIYGILRNIDYFNWLAPTKVN